MYVHHGHLKKKLDCRGASINSQDKHLMKPLKVILKKKKGYEHVTEYAVYYILVDSKRGNKEYIDAFHFLLSLSLVVLLRILTFP